MRLSVLLAGILTLSSASALAQEIVKVPASEVDVTKPEDLYALAPGRWHLARQLWRGHEPCISTQCEAGYTSGDLVVSAEHEGPSVTITASWRDCASTAYSQLDIGDEASKSERKKIAK